MLLVPVGSVDNERIFLAIKFVKNDQRNRLDLKHLNTCVRPQVFTCFDSKLFRWSFLTKFTAGKVCLLSTLPTGTPAQSEHGAWCWLYGHNTKAVLIWLHHHSPVVRSPPIILVNTSRSVTASRESPNAGMWAPSLPTGALWRHLATNNLDPGRSIVLTTVSSAHYPLEPPSQRIKGGLIETRLAQHWPNVPRLLFTLHLQVCAHTAADPERIKAAGTRAVPVTHRRALAGSRELPQLKQNAVRQRAASPVLAQ